MRVAFISDWFTPRRGGIETHLQGLGRALIGAGAEVTAITSQPAAVCADFPVTKLSCLHLPGFDLAISPTLADQAYQALKIIAPQVVHIHASIVAPTCLAGLIAARRLGLPIVVTFHSDLRALTPLLTRAAAPFERRWKGVVLTAVSAQIARQVACLQPEQDVAILSNGFDAKFWGRGPQRVPGDVFRIVSALRFERKKRPHILKSLRKRVAQVSTCQVELVIAGEGSLRREFGGGIHTPGWLDRDALRQLYHSAHLFVMPSKHESFGIATLEARAAGLPIIGRSGTGLSEFIVDGTDGFLCDTDAAMAKVAARLANDTDLWARMAGARPELEQFDWANVAERHLGLYAQALSKPLD